jgi:hypothetical protein
MNRPQQKLILINRVNWHLRPRIDDIDNKFHYASTSDV